MTISFQPPQKNSHEECANCKGGKQAPIAGDFMIGDLTFSLCEECGRDAANVIGFACVRDGGWSKLEPRKRRQGVKDNG